MDDIATREAALVAILGVFILEHIGRRQNVSFVRPSIYLGGLVCVIRWIVRESATIYAHVTTFPSVIQLWEIYKTTKALFEPIFDLLNIPFDWHNAAVTTARRVASVDHMRCGTLFIAVFGWVWYCDLARDFYLVIGGGIICLMILIHMVTSNVEDAPPPPATPPPAPPLESPPPRRRAKRNALVIRQGD